MNRDTVTGIVGAAILVVAMVGVFQYERTIGAARAGLDDGDFSLTTLPGPSLSEATPLGQSTDSVVSVAQQNLTNVTFKLTWSGQSTNTLSMAVQVPADMGGATYVSESESDGEIVITVPVPNAQPAAGAPTMLGVGDWQVSVAFESATSTTPTPLPPVGQDESVTWSLAVTYEAWEQPPAQA